MMGTQSAQTTSDAVPAISVIMPAYGVTTMLCDALDSLLAQERGDWEAIVIDDGDARVAAHVEPYLTDPRIRFVQTENGGLPTARNRAIAVARAPLISLLDGDDVYEPGYVGAMIAAIEASPRIGFACCDATYFGDDRVGERFSAYCPQATPASLDRVLRRQFNVFICTAIRREAIDGIGGFDPTLKSAEDLDAWLRLLEAGWELAYVPRILARYRRRQGQMSSNTAVMLQSALTVFDRARQRLAGRSEEAVATEMCAHTLRAIDIEGGLALIRKGDIREGIAILTAAGLQKRSLKWRLALLAMRILPPVARPLILLRDRL